LLSAHCVSTKTFFKVTTSWFLAILVPLSLLVPKITDPCEDEAERSDTPMVTAEMLTKFINFSFSQGRLGLGPHRDYYLDREKYRVKIAAYKELLIRLVKLIHDDANVSIKEEQIAYDVEAIIDFESKLAKIVVATEDLSNFTEMYNLRRLSDMQTLMPLVNWTSYFYSVTPPSIHNYLAADPQILIAEIDYMGRCRQSWSFLEVCKSQFDFRLTTLLNFTDPVTITNYVYTRYTLTWGGELGEQYEGVAKEFHYLMFGQRETTPLWKRCVGGAMARMQYASGALYVRKAFNEETKYAAMEMVVNLQEAFNDILLENDWLGNTTKAVSGESFQKKRVLKSTQAALDKASQMLLQIGYPDFILDDEKLDRYYSEMLEKLNRWKSDFDFKRLIKPVNRNEFDFNPASVNAFYNPHTNSIKFPAGILQEPFFHEASPKALNYGGIGVRAQCIIDQYSKIKVPETGQYLNGKLTQGENIADNGGVKVAFKKYGEEKRIKGLEQFSNEQMFFIGYGTIWCAHATRDYSWASILTDSHAPQKYRVNRVLANRPEFAAAFNCAVGTPMNPTDRCAIW
uniref:Peptidase_M13 domain-containing protein n=1 Tax=Angiostrongylus costaricensis TaxID=334426 RepID=A0A0R3PD92_ANGCS